MLSKKEKKVNTTFRFSYVTRPTLAALSLLLSFGVNSAPQADSWYVGAKTGWISALDACESNATSCSNDATEFGLFLGYKLNNWLILEAGYNYLGKIKATYPALANSSQIAEYNSEIQALEFAAKPYWQVSDNWSVFGKIGSMYWDVDVTGHEANFTHKASDNDWSLLLGTGVEYAFNRNLSGTLEYQWVNNVGGSDTGGTDISMVNMGLIYRFASTSAPASSPTPTP